MSKCQSPSTTTVLLRTAFTRMIILNLLLKWLLGSNLSQYHMFLKYLRSAVTTQGILTSIISRPPSISRVTPNLSSFNSNLEAKVACKKQQIHYFYKYTNKCINIHKKNTVKSLFIGSCMWFKLSNPISVNYFPYLKTILLSSVIKDTRKSQIQPSTL